MLYKRFKILNYVKFFLYRNFIQKLGGENPQSFKVYDYSIFYFGIMVWVKMDIVIFICGFMKNFKFEFVVIIYEAHQISFQTFFVWALLLILHTWNSSPLRSNLLQLQCTCCTVPTTSGRPNGSPLVWACQWPSSQSLSSPQLSHNNSLWA